MLKGERELIEITSQLGPLLNHALHNDNDMYETVAAMRPLLAQALSAADNLLALNIDLPLREANSGAS